MRDSTWSVLCLCSQRVFGLSFVYERWEDLFSVSNLRLSKERIILPVALLEDRKQCTGTKTEKTEKKTEQKFNKDLTKI